ncbi:protein translocase subunit SecD [Brachybacterium huguangmaarense]
MPARRLALAVLAALLLALAGTIGLGVARGGWHATPSLALDLEGGTQVILSAQSLDGTAISADQMTQARQIMADRVNALGVAETEISVQGGSNIVVDVPGTLDQGTSDALRRTAAMSFRPVLAIGDGTAAQASDGGASDAAGSDGGGAVPPSTTDAVVGPTQGSGQASDAGGAAAPAGVQAWSPEQITPEAQQVFLQSTCADPRALADNAEMAGPDAVVVLCDATGTQKLLLGPESVAGSGIADATVGPDVNAAGQSTGGFVVNLTFHPDAAEKWSALTTALYSGQGTTGQIGIVLDGEVVSAPQVNEPSRESTTISGSFTQASAQQLADQLRFGALPLNFTIQSEQQISSTLGSDQLRSGLIAGLIGLVLVVLYAIVQYRVLAVVTMASLVAMGAMTYGVITIMSNVPEIGYRLSLAGVAGLIVAIGFTADSFIVYFERVRDEIRDGRGIVSAVDHGWERARRTIVASDAVNVIAATVLYLLSTGSVRGFAFTLGLTTILDLVIVFLFTHPMLQALARTRFFGKGHPLSGLDPVALGRDVPAYAGRGRIRDTESRRRRDRAQDADEPVETLAARKARLAREAAAGTATSAENTDVYATDEGSAR